MSNEKKETEDERDSRQHRQDKDALIERSEQNRANRETWNNSGLLRDIQTRQCEMLEKLGEIKVTIETIETHTKVMNKELGTCKDDIANLKNKPLMKISWKQMAAIIGSTATLVTIVYTIIKIFLGLTV